MIVEEAGGGVPPGAICVHLPDNPLDFMDKAVRRRRRPYRTLCGDFTKLPPTVRILDTPDGETYLICKPHERYHGYCRSCAESTPIPIRGVIQDERNHG